MANIDETKIPVGNQEISIPGRLHDSSEDHVVSGANEIYDDSLAERQSQINAKLKHYTKMAHFRLDAEEMTRNHEDIQLRNELNSKQLELGAVQTDSEPIRDSSNFLTSGTIAFNLGYYENGNNPEWVYVVLDGSMRVLAGITTDGRVEWMVGVPTPVKKYIDDNAARIIELFTTELNKKVDKVEGKSLINKDYADGVEYVVNSEFLKVELDAEGNIIKAIRYDGVELFGIGYKIGDVTVTSLNNVEFLEVYLDGNNNIVFAIQKDGNVLFGAGVPKQIIDYVEEKIKKFNVEEINSFLGELITSEFTLQELLDKKVDGEYSENSEFIEVKIDKDGKIIDAINSKGEKQFNIPILIKDSLKIGDVDLEGLNNKEYYCVTLDSNNSIVEALRIDGIKEVNIPIKDLIIKNVLNVENDFYINGNKLYNTNNSEYINIVIDNGGNLITAINNKGEVIFGTIPPQIQEQLDEIRDIAEKASYNDKDKLMKVVINALESNASSVCFYIRTKYNETKDIIISHWFNENNNISFYMTYLGDKNLEDNQLMSNTHRVSLHTDSTGPIRAYTQYWHLFGQHGYIVPRISNKKSSLTPSSRINSTFINVDGEEVTNSNMRVDIYNVIGGNNYAVSYLYSASTYAINVISWFDANDNFISGSLYKVVQTEVKETNVIVIAPANAVKAYINVPLSTASYSEFKNEDATNRILDNSDVGAEWKDQLNRHYTIGKVTNAEIYLLPIIYQDGNGHYTRDWYSINTSNAITSLTYVSGGSAGAHTSPISNIEGYSDPQLYPIMTHIDRVWYADGKKITKPGTYYCDEFKVNEEQIGYDPATINNFFGAGGVDLTNADEMVRFTYSFNYKGANCAVNTTFNLFREAKGTYSGTQQEFFVDNGNYKAMIMIPKAKERNGIDFSKPFNSPSLSSPSYSFARNATDLIDVNDPIDRQIGFLYNKNNGQYLVGMAAGLSLVSGDTTKERRNINRPVGSMLLYLSPSNRNKFYIYATDSSVFENGYFPKGYFKEINFYVSYFDPAENVGQVYWYKDGNAYIIYAHCQSINNRLAIRVPDFMEGLKLSIIEKTSDTELLTEVIQNGKFYVSYSSSDANYIVLKTN